MPFLIQTLRMAKEEKDSWEEIVLLKVTCPRVLCIVPRAAQDFVASSLCAIGARPVFAEDPDDLESDLEGCAAVLLDSAAAKDLIRSLMTALELARSSPGLVLSTGKVAASEKRCALAQKLVNLCQPAVITGRITDLVALSKAITGAGMDSELGQSTRAKVAPCLKPAARSRSKSPQTRGVNRSPTPKLACFQYREGSKLEQPLSETLKSMHGLAARTRSLVHVHELNLVTCGEGVVQVGNHTVGTEQLASIAQVSAAVIAAVVGVVNKTGENITLGQVSHGAALFAVAVDTVAASQDPGTLRTNLLDELYRLNEPTLRERAKLEMS